MFEQTMVLSESRDRRAASAVAGLITQSVLLTAAVMVPMMFPEALPRMETMVSLIAPAPPVPPPAPENFAPAVRRTALRPIPLTGNILIEPTKVPAKVEIIDEPPLTAEEIGGGARNGAKGGVEGGIPGGLPNSILSDLTRAVLPVAPPQPVAQDKVPQVIHREQITRIRAGGQVQEALLIHRVIPQYPPLARTARIAGVVELLGIISRDGHIQELQVKTGHPLLVRAALDAVKQWVYRPTLLNGDPVEVVAPITVSFVLN